MFDGRHMTKPLQHLLQENWQFWLVLFTRSPAGKSQYQIEEITTIGTVESFYQYYTALPKAGQLRNVNGKRPSIALFRDGIKPAWEDPANVPGGAFHFLVPPDVVDDLWRDLLFCAIGGTLGDHLTPPNEVNGLVIGVREVRCHGSRDDDQQWRRADRSAVEIHFGVEIWVKGAALEPTDGPQSKMKLFLDNLESARRSVGSIAFKPDLVQS
jgi:hypothetical protein